LSWGLGDGDGGSPVRRVGGVNPGREARSRLGPTEAASDKEVRLGGREEGVEFESPDLSQIWE
jgi:hypothetical protein